MRKSITLLVCVLWACSSMADSIKYTVIFDGLELTEEPAKQNSEALKQSFEYNMICSIVDPAWQIFVSKDSSPFDSLLLKLVLDDSDLTDDDPMNALIEYISNNLQTLFYYQVENRKYSGISIEMPEEYLLDVTKKYGLPSELVGAHSIRQTRWQSFVKENEVAVMEKLLDVVSYMDINESLVIVSDGKPKVKEVTSVDEFSKILHCSDVMDNAIFNKSSYWRNNSVGKYFVELSYCFWPNEESKYSSYYDVIINTLRTLDIGTGSYDDNGIMICCHKINAASSPESFESIFFYSGRDYLDKWCFRLISILYDKFNSFVIADNLGNESKMPIVNKPFMNYVNMTYNYEKQFDKVLHFLRDERNYQDVAEIKTGTSLFNPFGILFDNPGVYNYYFDAILNLDEDIRCSVGFLLTESELESEIEKGNLGSYKPYFKQTSQQW